VRKGGFIYWNAGVLIGNQGRQWPCRHHERAPRQFLGIARQIAESRPFRPDRAGSAGPKFSALVPPSGPGSNPAGARGKVAERGLACESVQLRSGFQRADDHDLDLGRTPRRYLCRAGALAAVRSNERCRGDEYRYYGDLPYSRTGVHHQTGTGDGHGFPGQA
jgi:hypothetical protein